jgi:transcriptional regulator with XRE-family HTH domain
MGESKTEYRIDPARLRERREAKDWTLAHLAHVANIEQSNYVYQLERRPTNCGVDIATRLANALGCTIEDLTGAFPKGGKE